MSTHLQHPQLHQSQLDEIVSIDEVNKLIQKAGLRRERPMTDLSQCTSSFFVLLFQHVFYLELQGLELEADTAEKKLVNIGIVIDALERATGPLRGISPEAIISHDEVHISRLIRVFVDIVDGVLYHHGASTVNSMHPDDHVEQQEIRATGPKFQPFQQWLHDIEQPAVDSAPQRTPRETGEAQHRQKQDIRSRVQRIARTGGIRIPGYVHESTTPIPSNICTPTNLHRLDNVARDAKIERLRANRFTKTVEDKVVAAVVKEYAVKDREVRDEIKRKIMLQRRNQREILRFAKEEDQRFRDIYCDAVDSAARSAPHLAKRFGHTAAAKLTEERKKLKDTREASKRIERQQQRALDRQYDQFIHAICGWRNQNRIF